MQTFITVSLIVSSLYLIFVGTITSTKYILQSLVYKFLPMVLGFALIIVFLYEQGMIKQ